MGLESLFAEGFSAAGVVCCGSEGFGPETVVCCWVGLGFSVVDFSVGFCSGDEDCSAVVCSIEDSSEEEVCSSDCSGVVCPEEDDCSGEEICSEAEVCPESEICSETELVSVPFTDDDEGDFAQLTKIRAAAVHKHTAIDSLDFLIMCFLLECDNLGNYYNMILPSCEYGGYSEVLYQLLKYLFLELSGSVLYNFHESKKWSLGKKTCFRVYGKNL